MIKTKDFKSIHVLDRRDVKPRVLTFSTSRQRQVTMCCRCAVIHVFTFPVAVVRSATSVA